jgi:hypothetical protein
VIGLTLFYLALLGPLDYLLVHRWGRRPVWTWLTLPLVVLLVAGGAYGIAQASKGNRLRINQAELVDVDLESGLVRGNVWSHVYTPRHDRFTLKLRPQLSFAPSLPGGSVETIFSWLGLPGRGLGGLDATADGIGAGEGYWYEGDRRELARLPLAIWSSKSLHGEWRTTTEELPIQADLRVDGETELAGHLLSRFDHALSGARVYYGGRIYSLGTLQPGQSFEFVPGQTTYVSAGYDLRRLTTLGKDAPPYDAALRDARRVLQMMSWYKLAGGARYAGLLNRYESRIDFGHLLDAGRAVLVGEMSGRGSQIVLDDQAVQDSDGLRLILYRVVIPVAQAEN